MVIFHTLLSKIALICSQIINLNKKLGNLPLSIEFWRIYIPSHFSWTLPDRKRGNGNVLLFWYHVSDRYNDFQ